jgi:hypothetical protein
MPKRTFDDGATFGQNVKAELMEFRGRIEALEAAQRMISQGGVSAAPQTPVDTENVDESGFPTFDPSHVIMKGFDKETDNVKSYSQSVMEATYLMHEAATATRGYAQLLTEMGLSKDQKKMLHELEQAMMMFLKMGSMLRLLIKAQEEFDAAEAAGEAMGPLGWLEIILAGGMGSASLGYGMRLKAGDV